MLKASALYIVIIIALVIAVLCSALIVTAYYYTIQNKQKIRYDRLENNLNSCINILLANRDSSFQNEKSFSLFKNAEDSVSLKILPWVIIPGKVYHHSAAKGTSDLRCKRAVKAPSSLSSMIFSKLSNFSCSA